MPLTSQQNNITSTPSSSIRPTTTSRPSPPPTPSTPEPSWRHRKHLLTSTTRICDHPVPVLFDEGSQVNVISPQLVKHLSLQTSLLPSPRRIMFPNGQHREITEFVPSFSPTFPAIRLTNEFIRLHFSTTALIMETHYPLILGVPFLRYWNISSHHCNGSLIFTADSGHHAIIPLQNTRFTQPCRTTYCPIARLRDPPDPLPHIPPFVLPPSTSSKPHSTPPITDTTATPSMNLLRTPTISPPQLVSAVEFMRHSRSSHAQLFICVFRSLEQLNAHIDPNDTDTARFADHVKTQALTQFPTLFPSELPSELPPPDRLRHPIDLTPNHKIPPRKLYRQSENELRETKRQIYEYLDAGHIRPSSSSFGAPVLLVKKKDGSMRMCIDYRRLNDITVKNNFPIPCIDDLYDRLGKAKYFTKLDLYSGYHQIAIRPGDEHKTAFTSRYGTYEFLVMPFGLTNAPATFQTAMTSLFAEWLDVFVIVYLDDILIYSPTKDDHINHVTQVMHKLHQHQWYCKLKKCEFATTSVEYLSHIVSNGNICD